MRRLTGTDPPGNPVASLLWRRGQIFLGIATAIAVITVIVTVVVLLGMGFAKDDSGVLRYERFIVVGYAISVLFWGAVVALPFWAIGLHFMGKSEEIELLNELAGRPGLASTKQCPFCRETIRAAATLCRYCRSNVSEVLPSPVVEVPDVQAPWRRWLRFLSFDWSDNALDEESDSRPQGR